MKEIKTYEYKGANISFELGEGIMINATQMAKAFSKAPKDYLRTQSAKIFISAISVRHKCPTDSIVKVVKGGISQGTWMHEDVALDFAQWLSVDFKLWCNDRIKDLLSTGNTSLKELSKLEILKMALESETQRIELAEKVKVIEPKARLADRLINCDTLIDVGQAAKALQLPYGRNKLYSNLRSMGIFFRDRNEPKQYGINQGYFKVKESIYTDKHDVDHVSIKVLVTQKGLAYLAKRLRLEPELAIV